jgi:hypothetical protein
MPAAEMPAYTTPMMKGSGISCRAPALNRGGGAAFAAIVSSSISKR